MKKKWIKTAACMLSVVLLAGCGKTAPKEETTLLQDIDVDKYVTLGEYKGLDVMVMPVSLEEEEVLSRAQELYASAATQELGGITDRAVEEGDTVNIDYEGKRDGVAFDGGTAQGAELTIGSGRFIEGFEEGLIGVMPKETVDLQLTFPADYHSEELAGAEVVFTVTVNFIMPDTAEMTDDQVAAATGIAGVETVDDLKNYVRDNLSKRIEQYNTNTLQNNVLSAFLDQCDFRELPQNLLESYENLIRQNIDQETQQYNNYSGQTMDSATYLKQMYGQEDLDAFVTQSATDAVKQGLALQAVANREDLNLTDEALDARILEAANEAGYDTIESFLGSVSKDDYREYYLNQDVLQFLTENANVTEQ